MQKSRKLFNKKNIPFILFFISFVILLIRARFSFCWSDESFYQAVTSRFYNGDQIFYDEWFPTQLSSLLMLPLHSIYVAIFDSTEGIILFFRVLFVILELISAITIYKIVSKYHGMALGTECALLIQWYTHLNIATLSYYTMSTHFFVLSMFLIYDCYMSRKNAVNNVKLIIAGFLFALCVLCLPTMCVAYFLVVFCGFLVVIADKVLKEPVFIKTFAEKLNFIHTFVYTLIGIVIPAVIFTIYMLTHVSLSNFISSLEFVLSDDEHELSKLYPLKKMYLAINESYERIAKLAYLFIALSVVIFAIMVFVKYTKENNLTSFLKNSIPTFKKLIFAADIVLFTLYFVKSFGHTGYIFTAMMLFSLPLFLITEKKNWTLFILTFVSGLLFALVYSYSSNGMLYLLSMGHFICSLGGFIFVKDFSDEIKFSSKTAHEKNSSVVAYVTFSIITICVLQTCILRITNIYRDDSFSNLTEMTQVGPAKGLYTSPEHIEMYMNVYDAINEYCMSYSSKDNDNKTLLISKLLPYGYLISDLKVAAPTVWRNPMGSLRLKEYYEIHEDRYPDVILVLDEYYGSYETCGDVEADYTPNENDSEGYIYDYIEKNNMKKIPVKCGTIYTK